MYLALAAAAVLSLNPQAEGTGIWICEPQSKYLCMPEIGCTAITPNTWAQINLRTVEYQRCDDRGCDSYTPEAYDGGSFITLSLPSNGAMIRIADNGDFTEIATLALASYISYGKCEPADV